MIYPEPFVEWNGQRLSLDPADADTGRLLVDRISIEWGRRNLLEHPAPATASVRLIISAAQRAALTSAAGTLLRVGYIISTAPNGRANFRGTVYAADTEYLDRKGPYGGVRYLLTLSARSTMAELKLQKGPTMYVERTPPASQPVETIENISLYLQDAARNVVAGIDPPPMSMNTLARVDLSRSDCLEALEKVFTTAGQVVCYLPDTNRISWIRGRLTAADMSVRLSLIRLADTGKGIIRTSTAAGNVSGFVPAAATEAAPARQDTSTGQRYLEMKYFRFQRNAAPAENVRTTNTGNPARAETTYSTDTLAVDNRYPDAGGTWEATPAAYAEARLLERLRDAGMFTPPPLRMHHREGFHTELDIRMALAGAEVAHGLYVAGSVYNALADYPMFRAIGGVIEYAAGHWWTERTLAPVAGPANRATVTNEQLDSQNQLTWEDFEESITLDDLDNLEAGR